MLPGSTHLVRTSSNMHGWSWVRRDGRWRTGLNISDSSTLLKTAQPCDWSLPYVWWWSSFIKIWVEIEWLWIQQVCSSWSDRGRRHWLSVCSVFNVSNKSQFPFLSVHVSSLCKCCYNLDNLMFSCVCFKSRVKCTLNCLFHFISC